MFWENSEWSAISADDIPKVLGQISSGLPKHQRQAFCTLAAPRDAAAPSADQLVVGAIRYRALAFYPGYWLYELDVSVESAGLANQYESARAYAVVTQDATDVDPDLLHERVLPLHRPRTAAVSTILLDWTSGTTFALNERARLRLAPDGRFDQPLAIDYLDFFVSFLAGEGHRDPFLLLRGGTLAQPDGLFSERARMSSFEQAIGEFVFSGSKEYERPARPDAWWPEDATIGDEPDLQPAMPSASQAAAQNASSPGGTPLRSAEEGGPATSDAAPPDPATVPIRDIAVVASNDERLELTLSARMVYQDTVYDARLVVSGREGSGAVAMVEDDPLISTGPGMLPYQLTRHGPGAVVLLLRRRPRRVVTAAVFLDLVRQAATAHVLSPSAWVENVRVAGSVAFQSLAPALAIRVRDTEFMDRVVLDECRREASVQFERCRFARTFSARNCCVQGDLVLRESTVAGVELESADPKPAVDLDGLRLSGSLHGHRLTVDGKLSAESALIEGRLDLRGIECRDRGRDDEGVSLSAARVTAGVDLSPYPESDAMSRRVMRSRVAGTLAMRGLQSLHVNLSATACLSIDLSYARIEGLLNLDTFDPDLLDAYAVGNALMRTIVRRDVILRCTRMREIWMSSVLIHGDLTMVDTQVDGNVFCRSSWLQGYRCRIDGIAILSSAHIRGDMDFTGARIVGGLEMRTGTLGRLGMSLCAAIVRRGDRLYVDYFPVEVGHLELVGITRIGKIDLAGIQIRGNPPKPASVQLGVVSHGDVSFAWNSACDGLLDEALQFAEDRQVELARASGTADGPAAPLIVRTMSGIACRARVMSGHVDLRRIVTAGRLDLTHLHVEDGSVLLNDARIGTDLSARRSPLRGEAFKSMLSTDAVESDTRLSLRCRRLELDNVQVGGDALLSGVDVIGDAGYEHSVSGRNLRVTGTLEFFAGAACQATIAKGIDLRRALASELSLPGRSNEAVAPESDERPIVLEHCRFGKLRVDQPIPKLNLTDIKVGSLELGTPGAAGAPDDVHSRIAILSQMEPMDRSVWTSVEADLRNEARTGEADLVHRTMRTHQYAGAPWWKRYPATLFLGRLYGYGTRLYPALAFWLLLSILLFAVLQSPTHVKMADGILLQLDAQCRVDSPASQSARCLAYQALVEDAGTPAVEITASRFEAEGGRAKYGIADAVLLSLRYAIPFVATFGHSDWRPADQVRIRYLPEAVTPSILATIVLVLNSLLLSFAAAFLAKRMLR